MSIVGQTETTQPDRAMSALSPIPEAMAAIQPEVKTARI
jgi:hypothetical protein